MDASFVACKLYALRNPEDHSIQKVKGRGIPKYFVEDSEANAQRRLGAKMITFDDVEGLLHGRDITFTREQITINQKLLHTDVHNIKIHALMSTKVSGRYDKRIVSKSGLCRPIPHCGEVVVP
jgi:hypothetical protein